jgi:hypothetical protein
MTDVCKREKMSFGQLCISLGLVVVQHSYSWNFRSTSFIHFLNYLFGLFLPQVSASTHRSNLIENNSFHFFQFLMKHKNAFKCTKCILLAFYWQRCTPFYKLLCLTVQSTLMSKCKGTYLCTYYSVHRCTVYGLMSIIYILTYINLYTYVCSRKCLRWIWSHATEYNLGIVLKL